MLRGRIEAAVGGMVDARLETTAGGEGSNAAVATITDQVLNSAE